MLLAFFYLLATFVHGRPGDVADMPAESVNPQCATAPVQLVADGWLSPREVVLLEWLYIGTVSLVLNTPRRVLLVRAKDLGANLQAHCIVATALKKERYAVAMEYLAWLATNHNVKESERPDVFVLLAKLFSDECIGFMTADPVVHKSAELNTVKSKLSGIVNTHLDLLSEIRKELDGRVESYLPENSAPRLLIPDVASSS
ncbi:hypothetical protein PAPHI01_1751 [Pancytospora philotis]|nr:hypothetical protein PAPHI01_1536 [Pancytospora philotis]KAI4292278.1 hypothetical protein PAPHI01_1552 [Pancytospora philotis]KAI4292477.1 hypothetical protein PAPHI01_1751 [Pancytospora philotis]